MPQSNNATWDAWQAHRHLSDSAHWSHANGLWRWRTFLVRVSWIDGTDYRVHWSGAGLYSLYPNGGVWPLSWRQVIARVRAGVTPCLLWLNTPEDIERTFRLTVDTRAELVAAWRVWTQLERKTSSEVAVEFAGVETHQVAA